MDLKDFMLLKDRQAKSGNKIKRLEKEIASLDATSRILSGSVNKIIEKEADKWKPKKFLCALVL